MSAPDSSRLAAPASFVAFAVLAVLSMALPATPARSQGGPPPAKVLLAEVLEERVEQWREVTGSLHALRRATLAAEVEGRALEVPVREGVSVLQGALIARQDDTLLRLDVEVARAEVAASRATTSEVRAGLEKARRDLPRAERLYRSDNVVSEQVLQDAATTVARAEAGVARAEADVRRDEAELARARERLADAKVTAPFAGTVVARHAEAGEWLRVGDPIAVLLSAGELEAWLDVPERYLGRLLELEGGVQLRLPALGRVMSAPVTAVVPEVDQLARTLKVRVAVPDPKDLAPGMSVVGLVPTGAVETTLTVPEDAILRDDAGELVYFDAGGVAAVARIETLFATAGRVAVRSSTLQPGSRVVVEGNQRLFPGQPLLPMNAAPSGS